MGKEAEGGDAGTVRKGALLCLLVEVVLHFLNQICWSRNLNQAVSPSSLEKVITTWLENHFAHLVSVSMGI